MNKNKILKLTALAMFITVGATFVSCGKNEVKDNKEEISKEEQLEEKNNGNKEKEEIKVEKIDFSKYSDEEIVSFVNNATDDTQHMERFTGNRGSIEEEDFYSVELDDEDLKTRAETLSKYYSDINLYDEYTEIDGKTYLKDYLWDNKIPYLFSGIKSKEVIDDSTLRVVFNSSFYHGYPVVNKNTKTVDFTEVDGNLKAKTLLIDKSIYGVIENRDESRPIEEVDNEAKELWYYVYEKLNDGILRADQKVVGMGERRYDEKTDSVYYDIAVNEPTQSAVCYYVNPKNGDIYGHYENKFVVKAGKVVK